ncbi:hypothetical protein GCM10009808_21430 [Microbacterium sediminicola]|uniref:Ribonuclease P protein component n=1 Tax=Microbacterium sediminicola TaxID=415210 RepID=A0ABN2IE06_9MICO
MLARAHRLTRGEDYRAVVRRGRRRATPNLVVYATASENDPTRFGFIVSKQVGTAVTRNTVRRRLKAVASEVLPRVTPGTQVVLRALPPAAVAPFGVLAEDVSRALLRGER